MMVVAVAARHLSDPERRLLRPLLARAVEEDVVLLHHRLHLSPRLSGEEAAAAELARLVRGAQRAKHPAGSSVLALWREEEREVSGAWGCARV